LKCVHYCRARVIQTMQTHCGTQPVRRYAPGGTCDAWLALPHDVAAALQAGNMYSARHAACGCCYWHSTAHQQAPAGAQGQRYVHALWVLHSGWHPGAGAHHAGLAGPDVPELAHDQRHVVGALQQQYRQLSNGGGRRWCCQPCACHSKPSMADRAIARPCWQLPPAQAGTAGQDPT
jgi:hypothetical protein